MSQLRNEFIKEIMHTLKIEGVFNTGTIADDIQHIPDTDLRAFHKALFGTQHSYLNGMDRIIKVAEHFKPTDSTSNEVEIKANELIELVHSMNYEIDKEHARTSIDFNTLLAAVSFPALSKEDEAILNRVKPHYNLKTLIGQINTYQTAKDTLEAFKQAIQSQHGTTMISHDVNKMIPNKRG